MPVCEIDPWRMQYFSRVPCPDDVFIPTEDSDAWLWNPSHRWVYDKLAVAMSQDLDAAPHGISPTHYPVFSKPIYNLKGMGVGSRALASEADYLNAYQPGHFWSTLLEGDHVSSDLVVIDGEPKWWRHARGVAAPGGTFDYWEIHGDAEPGIESWVSAWCRRHLRNYTGMLNVETIGARIIEVHLRFADQWPDLYGGDRWVEALVRLYAHREWSYDDADRRVGYSVVLFAPHGRKRHHPSPDIKAGILAMDDISSLQITFREDWAPERHAMPPGGFRLAIVNCWNLTCGKAARDRLRTAFDL